MSFDNLIVQRESRVARLTVQRPHRLNALDSSTLDEIRHAVLELQQDDSIRCVIITGAGDKAFVAGADINEIASDTPDGARRRALHGQHVFDLIEQLGKPVIAAVNGFALGGGCELAMACTLRIAADTARFGQPEINLGLIPGFAGTQRLARLVGKTKAMELILTGRNIGAREAEAAGLVSRVVPSEATVPAALELAGQIAAMPPVAVLAAKAAVNRAEELPLEAGLEFERRSFYLLFDSEDQAEGMAAFAEKRPPRWKGR